MFNNKESKNVVLKKLIHFAIVLLVLVSSTETYAAEPYSGSKRWSVDDETIERIARVAADETSYKQGKFNPKYAQQDMTEFASKWTLQEAVTKDFTFINFKKRGDFKTTQLYCVYQEPLEPFIEAGVDLKKNAGAIKTVEIIFWSLGNRAVLDTGMYRPNGWDGHADAEAGECPKSLAIAMELGFGPEVWELKKSRFKSAVDDRVRYLKTFSR